MCEMPLRTLIYLKEEHEALAIEIIRPKLKGWSVSTLTSETTIEEVTTKLSVPYKGDSLDGDFHIL